ncbi:RNA polymerase sigma factor RpoD [uncultured archaeon]|nr:RNA polymerase sigma factor RpoD [uncultured archaeon]
MVKSYRGDEAVEKDIRAEAKQYPLLSKEQEQSLGREILYYKQMIVGLLSFLPDYKGSLHQRLVRAVEDADANARTHIISRETPDDEVIRPRFLSCVDTIRKIDERINELYSEKNSDALIVGKKAHRLDLLNEFRYSISFISELVADLRNTDLPKKYSKRNERIRARHSVKMIGVLYDCCMDAFGTFAKSNLLLVVDIARKYSKRGLPLSDLVNEGFRGMVHAVDKYDYTRNLKFSTYATWWIRQAVLRAIANSSRTIRLPVYVIGVMSGLHKTRKRLFGEGVVNPSIERLAEESGIKKNDAVNASRKSCVRPVSLDRSCGWDEENVKMSDFVKDDTFQEPIEYVSALDLKERIRSVLSVIDARDREILELRFGLSGRVYTLEEVGAIYNLSRERVRQIEAHVLRKLSHPSRRRRLEGFLDRASK